MSLRGSKEGCILFCGAFQTPSNGTKGGVLYACETLLDTQAAKARSWTFVDSAQPLPPPSLFRRVINAGSRVIRCIYCLLFCSIQSTLVFSPFLTLSLLEKLTICLVSSLLGRPTVIAFRSEIVLSHQVSWFMRPVIRAALKRITCVVCQSKEAQDALMGLFPDIEFRTVVIPNWTKVTDTHRVSTTGVGSACESGCSIAFLGWLEPIKDVQTILRALSQVNATTKAWDLSVCGSGAQSTQLQKLTEELGLGNQVRFRGWVDASEKARVFEQADMFVMASLSEGMPNSLVEAMSHGIPVVSSDVGGIPSLVEHGVNGLLFPARDVQAAASCLEQLICEPETRRKFGIASRQKIARKHNAEIAAVEILHLLDRDSEAVV